MKALDGLLVVSIEQAVAAPLCSSRLAEAGARVIKIERSEGDFARRYDSAACGESSYFAWLNGNKESLCVDFKTTEGAELLWSLIESADVVIQNLAPGALSNAGFSTHAMQSRNKRLIVCNISGYGESSMLAERRGYDLLIQAESGLISVSGAPDHPGRIGVSLCDIGAGVTAYSGILEALIKRGITGEGCELSVSLFDVAAEWMSVPFIHAHYGEGSPKPAGLKHPSIAPYGDFVCSDHRLVLVSIQNEREWVRLCEDVLNAPELLKQVNYQSNNARVAHRESLEADIGRITATMTSDEFSHRLLQAGIAYGAIHTAEDLMEHPAFRARKSSTADDQVMSLPAHPIRWTGTVKDKSAKTPALGEHTEAIKAELGKR